jgi:hypothetical protein
MLVVVELPPWGRVSSNPISTVGTQAHRVRGREAEPLGEHRGNVAARRPHAHVPMMLPQAPC